MEPGCSNIVSVSFHDVASTQNDKELGNLIAQKRLNIDSNEEERIKAESKGQESMDFNVALEVEEEENPESPENPVTPDDGSMEASE